METVPSDLPKKKLTGKKKILLLGIVFCISLVGIKFLMPVKKAPPSARQYETVLTTPNKQAISMSKIPATELSLVTPKETFTAKETPVFSIRVGGTISHEDTILEKIQTQITSGFIAYADDPVIVPSMEISFKREIDGTALPGEIISSVNGEMQISPMKTASFRPGKYKLVVKSGTRNIEQDFTWGVLAVNTNKSIYTPGETVKLGMAVLDDFGRTKCITGDTEFMTAKVWLTITAPDGSKEELSTENKKVQGSDECYDRSVTNTADFLTTYKTKGVGKYLVHFEGENQNGKRSIEDFFEVKEDQPFTIERSSLPTRIYPSANYTHTFTVKANQSFTGEIVERTPAVYKILDCGGCQILGKNLDYDAQQIDQRKQLHVLVWQVNMQAGETKTFTYVNDPPNVSPEFFLMGPVGVYSSTNPENNGLIFEEARQWQVASDAIVTWDGGGGGDTNWNTAANWSSNNTCDLSTETCTFDNTSDNNATINVAIAVEGIDINTGYDGTITQSSTNTVTLYTNGFDQSSATSTYTGGSGSFTTDNSSFTLSSGTFSTTTGTFNIHINFTYSGGTFTNNASGGIHITESGAGDNTVFGCTAGDPGTVDLDKDTGNQANFTLSSGCTLATVTAGAGNAFGVLTIDGTMTLTSGTLNINANSTVTGSLTINATPTVTIERNLNVTGTIVNSGTIRFIEDDASDNSTFTCAGTVGGTVEIDKDVGNLLSFTLSSGCTVTTGTAGGSNKQGAVTINGSFTLTSGTLQIENGDLTVGSSGVLTINNGTQIDAERNVTSTGDIINNGTIHFLEDGGSDNSTFTCNDTVGGTVEIDKDVGNLPTFTLSSGCTVTTGTAGAGNRQGAVTINGDFTLTSGTLQVENSDLTVGSAGILTINNGTQIDADRNITSTGDIINNGTIRFNEDGGSDNSTFTCNDTVGGAVEIDKDLGNILSFTLSSGCTVTGGVAGTSNHQSTVTINGSFTLASGTLQVEAGALTVGSAGTLIIDPGAIIDADRNWTESTTSVTTNNGTIRFHEDAGSDNNTWTCGTASNLGDVEILKATGNNGTVTLASDCTVEDFTRTDGAFNNPGSAYTLNVRGNFSMSTTDTFGGANATINMSGPNTQTISHNAGTFSAKFTVNKSGGTASISTSSFVVTGQTCIVVEGNFDINNKTFTCATGFTVQDGGNFIRAGAESTTTPTLDSGSTVTYKGDGDAASDTFTVTTMTANYHHLIIASTDTQDTYQLGVALDCNGSFIVNSGSTFTTTGTNYNMTIGGDLTNNGTMTLNSNTVTLDTTTLATVSGSATTPITFNNLTMSTGGKTVQFGAGKIIPVNGTLTMNGSAGNLLTIKSSLNGSVWKLNIPSPVTSTYLAVQDSGCADFTDDVLLDTTTTNNGNNEYCWRVATAPPRFKGPTRIKGSTRLQ